MFLVSFCSARGISFPFSTIAIKSFRRLPFLLLLCHPTSVWKNQPLYFIQTKILEICISPPVLTWFDRNRMFYKGHLCKSKSKDDLYKWQFSKPEISMYLNLCSLATTNRMCILLDLPSSPSSFFPSACILASCLHRSKDNKILSAWHPMYGFHLGQY